MAILRRFINYGDPNSFAMRLRRRRSVHIKSLIDRIHREKGSCRILDLGGTARYWTIFDRDYLRSRNCRIVVINLRPEGSDDEMFSHLPGDATDLADYGDLSFDLVHSNSVVEHLDGWTARKAFAREVRRLAARYYVQTPNFWFPVEPHVRLPFVHWLPRRLASYILAWTSPNGRNVAASRAWLERNQLLDGSRFGALFPDSAIRKERFLLMTKSLMAIRE